MSGEGSPEYENQPLNATDIKAMRDQGLDPRVASEIAVYRKQRIDNLFISPPETPEQREQRIRADRSRLQVELPSQTPENKPKLPLGHPAGAVKETTIRDKKPTPKRVPGY